MNKSIFTFIAGIAVVSMIAFGFVKYNGSEDNLNFDFTYEVDDRFVNTISKDKLNKALSVIDVIPKKHTKNIAAYQNIMVTQFAESRKDWVSATCDEGVFNEEQRGLLQELDYGASFSITGYVQELDEADGTMEKDTLIYYMSTVPAFPAEYKEGKEALISYLVEISKKDISIARKDKIQPGKISFKVTNKGSIDQLEIKSTSGYETIDDKMMELIKDIPGSWKIAKNAQGEKVAQEFTFFFGQVGC